VKEVEDMKRYLRQFAATNYHPAGTSAMMSEELGGVVDEFLKVYGTANVRVCDASIIPILPRGNILSTVYALAEKGADIMKAALQL
jgi:choline dehydrogenase-like flavoprotein